MSKSVKKEILASEYSLSTLLHSKAEMEANKKKNAKKENIWTAHANSDVSESQLNDSYEN